MPRSEGQRGQRGRGAEEAEGAKMTEQNNKDNLPANDSQQSDELTDVNKSIDTSWIYYFRS